jgi:hypothetical protein
MAIIADILTQVDAVATAVGATAFDAVAAEIVPVFRVGSVLVVALVGVNLMAQAVPMTLRNGLGLMVRIAVASAFLSSWTNFNVVYGVLTNAPSEIGAVVLEAFGSGSGNLYEGLDSLYLQALGQPEWQLHHRCPCGPSYVSGRGPHGDSVNHRDLGREDHDRRPRDLRANCDCLHALQSDRPSL